MAANRQSSLGALDNLPVETREEILSYCSLPDLGVFARVSYQAKQESLILQLMRCAVDAEPESYQQQDEARLAAIAILKRHPELLFQVSVITDHFGRRIKASPYQLLLGSGDVWALKQVREAIIPNIENGEAHAQAQFQAQFPSCPWPPTPDMSEAALYDDRNRKQMEQVIAQLTIIVEKINVDPCTNDQATSDETRQAVAELRKIFAPKEGEVIETGLHFPLGIMHEILEVYDAQWNPWSGAQLSFYSREVIGATESALTAVDGQCCKHGLVNLNMDRGPDRRDGLFCRHPKGIPQTLSPFSGKLGVAAFVDPYSGWSVCLSSSPGLFDCYATCWLGVGGCWCVVRSVGKIMSSKNSELVRLMPQPQQHTPKRRVSSCTLL